MADNGSEGVWIPEVFKNPPKVKIKKSKKKEKSSEVRPPDFMAISENISKEKDKPLSGYLKSPPRDNKALYCFHGEETPDPFRPLEDVESKDVQLWLNYQEKLLNDYANPRGEFETLGVRLRLEWSEPGTRHNFYSSQIGGAYLTDKYIRARKERINDHLYELRGEPDDFRKLIKKNLRTGEETILLDEETFRHQAAMAKFESIRISSDEKYMYLNFHVSLTSKNHSKLIKISNPQKEIPAPEGISFKAWHPKGWGFYYNINLHKEARIFYFDFSMEDSIEVFTFKNPAPDKYDSSAHAYFQDDFIPGGSLSISLDVKNRYERHERKFITHPDNPLMLVEIPKFQTGFHAFPKILGVHDGYIYGLVHKPFDSFDVIKIKLSAPDWEATENVILDLKTNEAENIDAFEGKIIAIESENLECVLRVYSSRGQRLFTFKPETPSHMNFYSKPSKDGLIEFAISDFLSPPERYILNIKDFTIVKIEPQERRANAEDLLVSRHFAKSRDGTEVPITLIHSKNLIPTSETPAILYGYGGFGRAATPRYSNEILWWARQGGIYAIAHIRGDGGWMEGWSKAGARRNKPDSFDDFIACGEYLIERKMTSSKKMVAMGGSQGGMMVVASMQKRPNLFGAVVSQIPILDMLNHAMSNFNGDRGIWVDDYGLCELPEDYEVLKSYSPLHNIKDDETYPPVLIMAMGKDRNAHPGNALKFIATMQDKKGESAAYLYIRPDGCHYSIFNKKDSFEGDRTNYDEYALMFGFIDKALGLNGFQKHAVNQ